MNILITAGSTLDFIDNVNYVSNLSDGSIAAGLGEELSKQFEIDQIFYICGRKTKYPWNHQSSNDQKFFLDEWLDKIAIYPVDDVNDLEKTVTELFTKFEIDSVIHLMNIVNYGDSKIHLLNNQSDAANLLNKIAGEFNLDIEIKNDLSNIEVTSNFDGQINSGFKKLFIEQNPTKKILKLFKDLKPEVKIISSKTSTKIDKDLLISNSIKSIKNNKSDLVIALDTEKCKYDTDCLIYVIDKEENVTELVNIDNISEFIYEFIVK